MSQSFTGPPPAGYCVKCHKGYAVGPHVCKPDEKPTETARKDLQHPDAGPRGDRYPFGDPQ